MASAYVVRSFVSVSLASMVWLGADVTASAATPVTASSDPSTIIGGGPVDRCDWPSTVFLENCTGTLIHPEIVVYAAHCGADRERVWFGEDFSAGVPPEGEGFSVDTEYCMTNPAYDTPLEIGPSRAADFAFCKLAEPVLDVPIVPPLAGCETTVLTSGTDVKLVGYGSTDDSTFAIKYTVDTQLHYIDDWGAAVIGGGGFSPCAGDSGGPAFVQLPDGTWRAFGIVSGPNFGNCGDAMWFATISTAIPFIEANSGIDVTACHYGESGGWNPSPRCGDFPLEPADGGERTWADSCAGGPALEWSSACGPAYDAAEDLLGPSSTITTPGDRERFDTEDGAGTYSLVVEADVVDAPSGVSTVALVIEGAPVDGSLKLSPPWSWELSIPAGTWEIEVVATDWAGNESRSPAVVIGIDQDPPPAPEPSTSSGADASSDDAAASSSEGAAPATSEGGDSSESSGGARIDGEDDGCGCRSTDSRGAAPLALGIVLLLRRRRRLVASLTLLAACSGSSPSTPEGTSTGTEGTSSSSSSTASTTTSESSTTEGSTTTSVDSSSSGPGCEIGTLDCSCSESFECQDGLTCMLDTCIPCETGTITCPCHFDEGSRTGECDEGLYCFGGLCASPQPCPYLMDGACDEPRGTGACLIGTDAYDCCAVDPGVCEEASAGGSCPDGSDPLDCGGGSSSGSSGGESGSSGTSDGSGSSDGGSGSSSSSDGGVAE